MYSSLSKSQFHHGIFLITQRLANILKWNFLRDAGSLLHLITTSELLRKCQGL